MIERAASPPVDETRAPTGMRAFYLIWLGELISILGSGLTSFALGVWIFQKTGSATPFAITVLFGNLPRLLLLPAAGSLADRWNRRLIMILADTGNALVTLFAVILLLQGDLQIWQIYLIAFCGSAFSVFQGPAYTSSITMMVPKRELTRANGLVQMSQALETLLTPVLAGALFTMIGLSGIILIDFATYFFAIFALIIVRIPQPASSEQPGAAKNRIWNDLRFGWNYLRVRAGLFGLLWYFAMVNLLLNLSAVLMGPLVLSRHSASIFGIVQTIWGVGMLGGSILASTWRGPKGQNQRVQSLILFIALGTLGLVITGAGASAVFPSVGLFVLMFFIPLASASSQTIFQTKVAPEVQGRVFAMRSMISQSMMPIAFLMAGPLADRVFEPMMRSGGALAGTILGTLLGTGDGRGVGLMFVLSGLIAVIVSGLVYANPRIRNLESELPDAVSETPATQGG